MKKFRQILFVLIIACGGQNLSAQTLSPAYGRMLEALYQKTVPLVTVPEAAKWQKTQPGLVFLDTREKREFEVSHIKGARWVGYDDFDLTRVKGLSRQTLVVVYCSVGYRSEKVGEKLLRAGFSRVYNLYGSIFEWVNQGYPVYQGSEKPTRLVHAYSRVWGVWLHKGKKVY